jgi:hypothetical protein
LEEDLEKRPRPDKNIRGELRWEGSEAQKMLKIDVSNGLHLNQKPKELWETRPEYQLFTNRVFQKHIDQAKQSRKEWDEATKARRYKNQNHGDKSLSRKNSTITAGIL